MQTDALNLCAHALALVPRCRRYNSLYVLPSQLGACVKLRSLLIDGNTLINADSPSCVSESAAQARAPPKLLPCRFLAAKHAAFSHNLGLPTRK